MQRNQRHGLLPVGPIRGHWLFDHIDEDLKFLGPRLRSVHHGKGVVVKRTMADGDICNARCILALKVTGLNENTLKGRGFTRLFSGLY